MCPNFKDDLKLEYFSEEFDSLFDRFKAEMDEEYDLLANCSL